MERGGFSEARLARLRSVLGGYVERGELPGLVALAARRGAVHVETIGVQSVGGSEPMRRDTIFRIASMTKPVTAVAAMILVEECRLRLDDPVDDLLPELANRQVLKRLDGPLDETEPAARSITLRDLLTMRLGIGALFASPDTHPIQKAMDEAEVAPSAVLFPHSPDEYLRRLGRLPLLHQPGARWMYHTGYEILGILIARAAEQSLGSFFQERIFAPLGMKDTGFSVPPARADRLPACYLPDEATGALTLFGPAGDEKWTRPPAFEAGGGGLVSTVDDYHTFCRMLLGGGQVNGRRILSRPSVELMTTDHITPAQKAVSHLFPGFWETRGWGFGLSLVTRRHGVSGGPGTFGWDGGYGTSAYSDPGEDLVTILMTQSQKAIFSPLLPDFWTTVYQAIDD